MEHIRSIWLASTKSIGMYRKFKPHLVIRDVKADLDKYETFVGVNKNVVVDRVLNAVKQSLRVRGINWLTKLRSTFVLYEKKLTKDIRHLQEEVYRNKQILKDCWPDLNDPNTSIASVIRYYNLRENYLKAKIKLDCLIKQRGIIHKQLQADADAILHEK